jgi:hypothetical protein
MAHAFDNRNFIPGKQQTFYSVVSPSSRPDTTNVLWEASSPSPRILSTSPQSSPKPNHPPPSYEESVFNKALANRHNSRSSLHSPSFHHYPTTSPLISYSLPSTPNDSHQYQKHLEGYHSFVSPHRSSDTKPPPPARMPKASPATHNNSHHRSNVPPQYSPNGMKTSTTYLNTTQLYITQSSPRDPPPPPPPRYPLQPPAIPPRSSPICHQTNSNFNSSSTASPKPTSQMVYRSPVVTSTAKRNDIIDPQILERQFHSLVIDNNRNREYSIGQCRKCDEAITNRDDTCDILGQIYHSSCAVCVLCGRSVKNKHYFVKDQLYCEEDFLVREYERKKHNLILLSCFSIPVFIKHSNIVSLVVI